MTEPYSDVHDPPRVSYRLRLTPDEAGQLGKYISAIVAKVRTALEDDNKQPDADSIEKLTIDLSDAHTVPSAQLVLLVNLLRRTVGSGVVIELSGVKPTILGSLVAFGLPREVTVIDSRGRPWTD